MDQPLVLGLRAKGQADVDHVRGLRAGVALIGADGLQFVSRPGIGIEFVDLDAVLGGEGVDHLAVVAPVTGQGDGRQHPFFLGGGDEGGHIIAWLAVLGGHDDLRRGGSLLGGRGRNLAFRVLARGFFRGGRLGRASAAAMGHQGQGQQQGQQ